MGKWTMLVVGLIIAIIGTTSGSALQKDSSFIVALKSDYSISDSVENSLQNDQPEAEVEDAATAEIYSLKIHSDIRFRYCQTRVISRVANRNANNSNEAVFQMVLPETAFISKFAIEIDGKVYDAYVKEKEEAKQIYTNAKNSGQSAGLVEVNARHANVFSVNINVEAKSKVTFNLTYEELLIRRFDHYEHVININPEKYARIPDFSVRVNLQESQNLTSLKVPALRDDTENAIFEDEASNAEVNITRHTGNSASISWLPTLESRRSDHWDAPAQEVKKFVVQYDVARESDAGEILLMNGYFVHFFAPKDILPLRKHVIFVLDTSGSMSGNRIAQLKQAMTYVLDDLKPDDYFNIIEFASELSIWDPNKRTRLPSVVYSGYQHYNPFGRSQQLNRPQPVIQTVSRAPILATELNLRKAHAFMSSIVASGGTNIHAALVEALKLIDEGRPVIAAELASTSLTNTVEPMIMFLTDGEPTVGTTNKDTILNAIKTLNIKNPVPIYSIGFGSGTDFPFLKTLSLQNRAFARKIYEAGDADIQMRGFYKEISSPALSNITFRYTSDMYAVKKLTSKRYPNFQRGSEIVVAGYLKLQKQILETEPSTTPEPLDEVDVPNIISVGVDATGRDGDVVFSKEYDNEFQDTLSTEDNFLERLWAYITIKQLLDREKQENEAEDYVFYDDADGTTVVVNSTDIGSTTEDPEFTDCAFFDEDEEGCGPNPQPIALKSNETSRQRALRIALKYGFVTPITSLVVVKPNETSSTANLDPLILRKPTPAPVTSNVYLRAASLTSGSTGSSGASRSRSSSSTGFSVPIPKTSLLPPVPLRATTNAQTREQSRVLQAQARAFDFPRSNPPEYKERYAAAMMTVPDHPYLPIPADFDQESESNARQLSRHSSLSRSGSNGNPLNRLDWLKDASGNFESFVTVNQTQYRVLENPPLLPITYRTCTLKTTRNGRVDVGNCKLLKDCVKRVFWNDESVYLKDYFCPIRHHGQLFAGACCWSGTVPA